jgi:hypothetical protein
MKNFAKYPALNNDGVPLVVWLCKPEDGNLIEGVVRKEIIYKT